MKKLIIIVFVIGSVMATAQPQLGFRFTNPGFNDGKFQFDVELKADESGAFHRDLQLYINYNSLAFGSNVIANGGITLVSLDLLSPAYRAVNVADNTASKFAIITEALFELTEPGNSGNFLEVPTEYTGLVRIILDVTDDTKAAGINFDQQLMNGGQYAQDFNAALPVACLSLNFYGNDWSNLSIPGQHLVLEQGWSGISSYLEPAVDNVEQLFGPVEADLIILNDLSNIYYPAQNINTLITWENTSGYVLKMNNYNELKMDGFLMDSKDLGLTQGWSLIPVFSACDVDIAELFYPYYVTFIKEVAGWNVYWPEYGINTLGVLEPGRSYFVYMEDEALITFPECTSTSLKGRMLSGSGNSTSQFTGNISASIDLPAFNINRTASTHTIALPASAIEIDPDCIILALDDNGDRYGIASWNGESSSLTIFGDDPLTQVKDGFTDNDLILWRAFNPATKEETDLIVTWDRSLPQHDGLFCTNGLSAVSELKLSAMHIAEDGPSQVLIYPNPTRDKVNVQLSKAGSATISVFDMAGQLIFNDQFTGIKTEINMAAFEEGIYLIEVKGDAMLKIDRLIRK